MKEIKPGLREKLFALYWLQGVLKYTECDDTYTNWLEHWRLAEKGKPYLELTPLSQITDEDAIECARLLPWFVPTGEYEVYKNHFNQTVVSSSKTDFKYHRTVLADGELIPVQVDFLRSKGYALPYLNYSVADLVKAGIFKLKD